MGTFSDTPNAMTKKFWTPAEIEFVENAAKSMSQKEVAEQLGRSLTSLRSFCSKRGIVFQTKHYADGSVRKVWSAKEISELYIYAERYSMPKVAKKLNRSLYSVKAKADELKISFRSHRLSLQDLSEILGVHLKTVAARRDKLGLSFRKNVITKGSMTGPTAHDIILLAKDFLEDPPMKGLRVSANHFKKVIEEYKDWEG